MKISCKTALPPHKIAIVRLRYREGESTYQLADRYYCCRQTIWEYVKDIKDRKRPPSHKLTDGRIKQIREGLKLGTMSKEIARELGISRQTVSRYGRTG